MNKWKMLGALTLAVGLVLAGTASGGITLGATSGNTAVWSTAQDTCGDYSAKLSYASGDNAYLEFTPDTGITVNDLATITNTSFWYYASAANGPLLELRFTAATCTDPDGAGHVDITVNTAEASPTIGTWIEETVTSASTCIYFGNAPDDGAGFYDNTGSMTLAGVLAAINAETEMTNGTAATADDWELTRVRAEIGWVAGARTCYIDDIIIDGDTTAVEPGTPFKLVWTEDPTATNEAGATIAAGKVSVQAADPDSGLIDTTGLSVTVKAYGAASDLLSDGLWNDGTDYNTDGISKTTTSGVATFGGQGDFDFSKVGTYKFRASSSGLTSGNSNNVTITYKDDPTTMEVLLTTPATMEVNTDSTISGLVKDKYGNIVTGEKDSLVFEQFAGGGTWGPDTVLLSVTGYASTSYTSGTSVIIGDSVRAYVKGQDGVFADTNYIALTPGALATIGATPPDYGITYGEKVVCDSLSGPFDVEILDAWGNHIDAEDVAGKQITVGTVHGPLGGSHTDPVLYGDAGAKVWRFNYIGGDSVAAVEDTIPIGIAGSPGLYDIEVYALVIGGPIADDSLSMTLSGHEVVVCGDSSNIITCDIVAKDKYGNLTEDREITFAITGSEGGAIGAAGDACETNASGAVTTHDAYLAGSKAQIIYLTATATDGGAWAKDTIYLEAEQGHAQIDSIAITAGSNTISAGQKETLTFTYFDEFGNIVNILYDAPDTTFDNIAAVGALDTTIVDTVVTDTLVIYNDATRARVYGVRLKKDYTGKPTLTETAVDTIVATAGAAVDTFLMTVVPTGEAAYFTVTFPAAQDTLTVNNPVTLTITAYDPDSNRVYTYGTDTIPTAITLSHTGTADSLMWSGTGVVDNKNGTGTVYDTIFGNGQATVNLTNRKAEFLTASVAEAGKLAAGTSDTITWIPDSLYYFGIVVQSDPIYTGVPFTFTVTPYDTFANITSVGLPRWIEFSPNEIGVALPTGPQKFTATTAYPATATNPSDSLQVTVMTTDGLIFGVSAPITVIGLYTLSGTVELSDNPGDLSGTEVMVTGGFLDTTDVLGYYEIPELLTRTYTIRVKHEGYQPHYESGVYISANTVMNFMLKKVTGIEEIPTVSFLSQNKPNPFAGGTTIEYGITKAGNVEIVVYNAVGQKVRTLVNSEEKAGYHKVRWDGTNDSGAKVGGGIYFYKITAGEFTSLKKLILLR